MHRRARWCAAIVRLSDIIRASSGSTVAGRALSDHRDKEQVLSPNQLLLSEGGTKEHRQQRADRSDARGRPSRNEGGGRARDGRTRSRSSSAMSSGDDSSPPTSDWSDEAASSTFARDLYDLVVSPDQSSLQWSSIDKGFYIANKKKFERKVLGHFFGRKCLNTRTGIPVGPLTHLV